MRTPLHAAHTALGATFTEFAGYEMPVHYGSIRDEHVAVRTGVGLFDVSHMSNLWIHGPRAAAALRRVCPMDPEALEEGRGRYTVVLREDGTILDDTFVFRLEADRYLMIPNAGMNDAVRRHITSHTPEAHVDDETADWAILALQGPAARAVLKEASPDVGPKFHRIAPMQVAGAPCLVSGTGYTGEKGVELYLPAARARAVWDHLLAVGAGHDIRPVGLGARDTLRLEKGYCLAGHEFAGGRTPLEANLSWVVDDGASCVGMDALRAQRETGHPLLWGLTVARGVARQGHLVRRGGADVGVVTSGTMSPTLGHGIALAYLEGATAGDAVEIDVRGRAVPATVATPPFI